MKSVVLIGLALLIAGMIVYGVWLTVTTPWDEWDADDRTPRRGAKQNPDELD